MYYKLHKNYCLLPCNFICISFFSFPFEHSSCKKKNSNAVANLIPRYHRTVRFFSFFLCNFHVFSLLSPFSFTSAAAAAKRERTTSNPLLGHRTNKKKEKKKREKKDRRIHFLSFFLLPSLFLHCRANLGIEQCATLTPRTRFQRINPDPLTLDDLPSLTVKIPSDRIQS